jgi:hypothetical protein
MLARLGEEGSESLEGLLGVRRQRCLVELEERVRADQEPLAATFLLGADRLEALRHLELSRLLPSVPGLLDLPGRLPLVLGLLNLLLRRGWQGQGEQRCTGEPGTGQAKHGRSLLDLSFSLAEDTVSVSANSRDASEHPDTR